MLKTDLEQWNLLCRSLNSYWAVTSLSQPNIGCNVYRVFTLLDTETDKKGCLGLCGDVLYNTETDTSTDSYWFCANLSVSVSVGVSVSASVSDSVNVPLLDWPVTSFYGQNSLKQ